MEFIVLISRTPETKFYTLLPATRSTQLVLTEAKCETLINSPENEHAVTYGPL